jgi:hypothetical protein
MGSMVSMTGLKTACRALARGSGRRVDKSEAHATGARRAAGSRGRLQLDSLTG